MAFLLPHFEYDAFVSYSHGSIGRESDAPLRDWTLDLINRLETDIRAVDTEFDDLFIWRDESIDPTIALTDELRGKVKSSGVLLIVMSPRYLNSSWCKDELEWFRQQIQEREREHGRIFVVRALRTDENQWPEFLRDARGNSLVGFLFHDNHNAMPFGWRGSTANHEAYVRELWRLQTALTRRLRELRTNAQRRSKEFMARPAAGDGQKRVYLHARPEYSGAYDEVKRVLVEDGIAPLSAVADPGRDIADWMRESRARIETAKRCDALALVRADRDEKFIGDLLEIGVDERERIQSARGAPLPCAVLDRSGENLPIDVSSYGIERFDVGRDDWRGKFQSWLKQARESPAAAS
jgi:TIR domain-containing protein